MLLAMICSSCNYILFERNEVLYFANLLNFVKFSERKLRNFEEKVSSLSHFGEQVLLISIVVILGLFSWHFFLLSQKSTIRGQRNVCLQNGVELFTTWKSCIDIEVNKPFTRGHDKRILES